MASIGVFYEDKGTADDSSVLNGQGVSPPGIIDANENCNMFAGTPDMAKAEKIACQNANGKKNIQYRPTISDNILEGINEVPKWINAHIFPDMFTKDIIVRWLIVFGVVVLAGLFIFGYLNQLRG